MLGKVQVARGREHPKVCGSGYDSRQRIRGIGHTVHELAGMQAGLEHVAGGQQHPNGRCANRRHDDEVAIEWWIFRARRLTAQRLVCPVLPAKHPREDSPRPHLPHWR